VFAALQFIAMTAVLVVYLILAGSGFFHTTAGTAILIACYILAGTASYFLISRKGENPKASKGTTGLMVDNVERVDESSHVFARNRSLRPGSEQYKQFYEKHSELEEPDAKRRNSGGPLGRLGKIDQPGEGPNCAATIASRSLCQLLGTPEATHPQASALLQDRKIGQLSPEEATLRIKGCAKNLGADLVGIAEINPDWIYSHRGEIHRDNWEDWGKEIPADHRYAVVVAEEMNIDMIGSAPHTPSVIESMKNYAKGAYISTQIASYIANLGSEATANHLMHYTAILPPLAVDAGLGEVGRLGYLMTREFGPRVRLSSVTTNLPLVPDKPVDIGVEDFCTICKKCATCCPSNSIPTDDTPRPFNGTLRWKLNAETCFDYWGKIGTDCCICMRVCPWSHARTFPHRLILGLISKNKYARRLFNVMDDIFYGKKPKSKTAPGWARYH
ncbi:MAG: reductive dehalogenase, partial [Desulfobacteraceae bacterium]|nr:reductive dehalogenase [Desulfobacteraceae bacterium]